MGITSETDPRVPDQSKQLNQWVNTNSVATFALVYDYNNSGYYIDLNATSRMNYAIFDNAYSYGWFQSPIFYDANNNGYYVDPNGVSRMNSIASNSISTESINVGGGRLLASQDQGTVTLNGNLLIFNGWLSVTGTKNFVIDHPLKDNYQLVHASLEGPEAGVYYRGTARLSNGKAKVTLPDYFDALTRDGETTILLTARGNTPFLLSYDEFDEKSFVVHGTKPGGEFDWEAKAVRADIPPLEIERQNVKLKGEK